MSRRRPGSEGSSEDRPEAGGKRRAPTPARLPPSGLAHEILAALDRGEAPTDSALPQPAPSVPSGPTRIYSFADSLERRDTARSAPVERLESWVTFELAGEIYALPALRIQEIQRAVDITRVPNAPAPVRGIMNLRGKVLVVVDLRQRLGVPSAPIELRSRILVVSSRERSLGLLVDAAQQVIKLPLSRIEAPPADVMTAHSDFLAGVVQLEKGLLIVLDIDQLLLVPEELQPRVEEDPPT
ncbi:MAG: chemotaxis protein CheW [Acidobacteriota bacterium]